MTTTTMTPPFTPPREAPRPRVDGKCVVCLRKRMRPKSAHPTARREWERDPFCSTDCAKSFYGVSSSKDDGWQAETARHERELDAEFLEAGDA